MACQLLLLFSVLAAPEQAHKSFVLIVKGADGNDEYARLFTDAVQKWEQACQNAYLDYACVGRDADAEEEDLAAVRRIVLEQTALPRPEFWLVLIGHGTFDGRNARFNLRGPDLKDDDLVQWLSDCKPTLVMINTSSSSGPFLTKLSGENRVIITATKSGHEQNYTRLNETMAASLNDLSADFDKDQQVSLLECFLAASRKVADFYEREGRLATEHALIDDNGDGLGTPADWFEGVHAVKRAKEGAMLDGRRAHQISLVPSERERAIPAELRQKRNEMELEIFKLRDRKPETPEEEYFAQLETLLLRFAKLCQEIDQAAAQQPGS